MCPKVLHVFGGIVCIPSLAAGMAILKNNAPRSARAPAMLTKYQKRISGPWLDRIDIHLEVLRVDYEKVSSSETSATISARYTKQTLSGREAKDIVCNADMRMGEVRKFCKFPDEGGALPSRISEAILRTNTELVETHQRIA